MTEYIYIYIYTYIYIHIYIYIYIYAHTHTLLVAPCTTQLCVAMPDLYTISAAPSGSENYFPGKKRTPVLPFAATSALALEMQAAVSTIALPHRPLSTSLCRPITTLRAHKLPHSSHASSENGESMIPSCLRNAQVCAYRSPSRSSGGATTDPEGSGGGGGQGGQVPKKKSKGVMWNLADGALTVAKITRESNADDTSPKADSRVDDNLLDSLRSVRRHRPHVAMLHNMHGGLLICVVL
jgi:hypothetical protein